jgi:hypothetical protein
LGSVSFIEIALFWRKLNESLQGNLLKAKVPITKKLEGFFFINVFLIFLENS